MNHVSNGRIKIALRENGLHSLWKGVAAYESVKKDNDVWSFKDAIMFIHHGVELLMKQILVNHSEYLVFEDLSESTVKKQKQANEQGCGIFFIQKPPRSVTYSNAVRRVEAFISPPELNELLISRLDQLNRLRNQIEHYTVDIDKQDVTTLLGKIHEPLLNLLEAQLGDIRETQPTPVIKAWKSIHSVMERAIATENRIAALVAKFSGQIIRGDLFAIDDPVKLPEVTKVFQNKQWTVGDLIFEADVVAESDSCTWVVEVKASQRLHREIFSMVSSRALALNATPWIVFTGMATVSNIQAARSHGILLSDGPRLDALEDVIQKG